MGKSEKSIKEFALIGFILLAVLFGMQIMVFIFGSLSSADTLDDVTQTITNETFSWINATGYTPVLALQSNFSGGLVLTEIWGDTHHTTYNYTIDLANATVSGAGVVTNLTEFNTTILSNVSISYTSQHKTEAEVTSEGILNDSLNAISNYSTQAGTQFTTLGIAITLILLVAVFLFFWQAFMGKKKGSGEGPASFS